MLPEMVLALLWFAFALSAPDVEAVYIRAVGFDARCMIVISYILSLLLRIVGRRCSRKAATYLGVGLSIGSFVISVVAARAAYHLGG